MLRIGDECLRIGFNDGASVSSAMNSQAEFWPSYFPNVCSSRLVCLICLLCQFVSDNMLLTLHRIRKELSIFLSIHLIQYFLTPNECYKWWSYTYTPHSTSWRGAY
jgi:hypothetical protein